MSFTSTLQSFARRALGINRPPADHSSPDMSRVGRWDSKSSDRLNANRWAKATGAPINAELSSSINELRARTEYECSSNPIVEGLINTYTVDVVGPHGPQYRVQSSDSAYNLLRESVWTKWWKNAGANRQLSGVEILRSWVASLWKAGEFGTQLINVENADGPIKLRLLPIHMHRLMTPPQFLGDPSVAIGVRRDENRSPISYYISDPYIFGPYEVYTGKFNEIPFDDFVHGYLLTEEDQVRGVPWLASCLDTIAQIRDWDNAMLAAAEAMAKTGILWQMKNPEVAPQVIRGSVPMERGQQTFGPPGYEATQIAPSQPTADQQNWRKSKKHEIGRGICMPGIIIDLDSSSSNYSSARFDNQPYWRNIQTVQAWLGRIGLDRIEAQVMREAELAGELPDAPDGLKTGWGWIKPAHVDPTKEAAAERDYLMNQTMSWSDAVISHGDDPDHVLERLKSDREKLIAAGLPPIPGIPGNPADTAQAPDQTNGSKGSFRSFELPISSRNHVNGNGAIH